MDLPLYLIVIFGITWISLLVGLIVACYKLVTYHNAEQARMRRIKDEYGASLVKLEDRKKFYKKRLVDTTAELIATELCRISLETEVEELKNQKLRAWDIPDQY